MENIQVSPESSKEAAYVEKKCEREFRKLFESGNTGTDRVVTVKKKCEFPEKPSKKPKIDEEIVSKVSSSSSEFQNVSHIPKCSLQLDKPSANSSENSSIFSFSDLVHSFQSLLENLCTQSCSESLSKSMLNLAVHCSNKLAEGQLSLVFDTLNLLTKTYKSDSLAISHSLLLLVLSKKALNLDQISSLEDMILKLADSLILSEDVLANKTIGSRLTLLRVEDYLTAYRLCQQLFSEKYLDLHSTDALTICCTSLRNLTRCEMGVRYKYKEKTLNFVLGMTGKATQEIVSENLIENDDDNTAVNASSHMVHQCLQILEHMLSVDRELPLKTLDHEDFSLLHCLTRLLGWCMSFLFQKGQSDTHPINVLQSLSSFHLATLVSILKVLSILSFNPDQYDTFTNIKGLMEKVMICILKAYFQTKEKHFDVLVLALELMINFFMKNRRTFVLLCLKKFQINGCEQVLSIEALLKILANSLDKINEIRTKALATKDNNQQNNNTENSEEANMKLVLEAADEDMELSTIVSYTSILLTFFMDTKTSFVEFIRERLSLQKSAEAITVSKKFLQFASITGGMPITGILLLKHAIKKISRLYPSS